VNKTTGRPPIVDQVHHKGRCLVSTIREGARIYGALSLMAAPTVD
jgi:hypothetical protein